MEGGGGGVFGCGRLDRGLVNLGGGGLRELRMAGSLEGRRGSLGGSGFAGGDLAGGGVGAIRDFNDME